MSLSEDHEIPLELMRNRPEAVAELARALFGLEVPAGQVRPASEAVTDVKIKDWRKDSVYLIGDNPVKLGLVLEVQRRWDEEKLYSWPVYHAVTRARHHCAAAVVVLCETKALAKRYAGPIKIGPGNHYRPMISTLRDLEPITDAEVANRYPEIATLAMLGEAPASVLKDAAGVWIQALKDSVPDDDARSLYHHYVVNRVPSWLRDHLEDMMTTMEFRTKSRFAAGYYAEGKAEGEIRGEIKALLTVLEGRGVGLTEEQRDLVEGCTDPDRIQGWLKLAGTVEDAEELFG